MSFAFRSTATVAFALAAAAGTALPALAQRTEGRNFSIAYEPGNASRNGYMDAQVQVTYYFGVCAGQVAFLARYNPVPHMLVGNHRYWVNGRQVSVPPHIAPPSISSPTIRGTIRGPNTVREINYVYATSGAAPSCLTNDMGLGPTSNFWPANTPPERQLQILNSFGLDYRGTLPPLRNSEVEAHFERIFAQERTDSLNRARAAEQQRLQARTDSLRRAQAAQAQRDSIARAQQQRAAGGSATSGAGAAAATAAAASASTSAGGGTSGQRAMTPAERQEAARQQAVRDSVANVEASRQAYAAQMAQIEEQRRQRAAYEQQLVQDVEAATVATVNLVGSIMEARRMSVERKKREEARQRQLAEARYAAYVAESRARAATWPERPVCAASDARQHIAVGGSSTHRATLSGETCRLAQGQSAVVFTLELDSDAPIVISASSSPLNNQLHLINSATNRGVAWAEGLISTNLESGRYLLVVSSRVPGEVGEVTVTTRKGWVSDAQGHLGFTFGPKQQINGFVGESFTSSTFMDMHLALQHRVRGPYLVLNWAFGYDTEASENHIELGVRQFIGPRAAKVRPFLEAGIGHRTIYVLEEPFTTVSPSFSAGLAWRVSGNNGIFLSAQRLTGSASNTDDIWTSPPPDIPMDRTIVRLGWMLF